MKYVYKLMNYGKFTDLKHYLNDLCHQRDLKCYILDGNTKLPDTLQNRTDSYKFKDGKRVFEYCGGKWNMKYIQHFCFDADTQMIGTHGEVLLTMHGDFAVNCILLMPSELKTVVQRIA